MSTLSLIVAYSDNHVIGIDNDLPWRLKADLAYFKQTTLGKPIIMGRKTWESLGRPLPGRRNMVISRDPHYSAEGAEIYPSLEDAITHACESEAEIFIIGGAQIYAHALKNNIVDRVLLTEIHQASDADVFFPVLEENQWQEVWRESHFDEQNNLSFDFVDYRKLAQ